MVLEFPLPQKTEGAHSEGEDRWDRWRGTKEGGSAEDGTIPAEGGYQVGLLREERGGAMVCSAIRRRDGGDWDGGRDGGG